jgi:hypothetical protein
MPFPVFIPQIKLSNTGRIVVFDGFAAWLKEAQKALKFIKFWQIFKSSTFFVGFGR